MKAIKNPKASHLNFKAGFWSLADGADACYHVTPNLSAILKSRQISSRFFRNEQRQTLGGRHDVSISVYNNITSAKNTLLYLYRVWQRVHGELTDERLRTQFGVTNVPNSNDANEILSQLVSEFNSNYPVVFGDKWAYEIAKDDLALIVLQNTSKYVFINKLWHHRTCLIDIASYPDLIDIFERSSNNCYLKGAYLSTNFYCDIMSNIRANKLYFESSDRAFSSKDDFFVQVFGYWGVSLAKKESGIYNFGNISFDLNPQQIPIDEICEYCGNEDEIRIFRPIPSTQFEAVISVEDVLEEATRLNGGTEPLFWNCSWTQDSNFEFGTSSFKFINLEPFKIEPFVQKINSFDLAFDDYDLMHLTLFNTQMNLTSALLELSSIPNWAVFKALLPKDRRLAFFHYPFQKPTELPSLSNFDVSFEMINSDDPLLSASICDYEFSDFNQDRLVEFYKQLTAATPLVYINTDEIKGLASGKKLLQSAREIRQPQVPVLILSSRKS